MRALQMMIATALAISAFSVTAAQRSAGPLIVGYVFAQDATLQPGQIEAGKLSRVNYAFANIADGKMVTGFAHDKENFAYLNGLKHTNADLKVLVSVGGWLWSTNFSDVALTRQSREVFIQSVMEFLSTYDLDGLDIDWEYPGMVGAGHPFRPEDKGNFTLLLKELRARFDQQVAKSHRKLYLTIAAGASDDYIAHTDMSAVQRYVDTVNLMAYDYYEPSSNRLTGNHAPLYTDPSDPERVSADASVKAFEHAGVPSAKLLLGVPFYGHVWGEVGDVNHGLFQAGKPIPQAYAPYSAIEGTMLNTTLNQGFTRYWDASASVPYLYNPEKKIFVSYEDAESIEAKCGYVLKNQLGGVMFWDYSGDPSGKLLHGMHDSFHKGESSGGKKQ